MTAVVYAVGVAVTEPVPVTTLPPRAAAVVTEEEEGVREPAVVRGVAGRVATSGGLISTVWGAVWGCPGTSVMPSVFTRREETLVTVPDWTVRPVLGRELLCGGAAVAMAVGGSTGTTGATPATELVL